MNKKLIFGSACLGLVLVLSACGTGTASPTASNNIAPDRRPDFGQPKTQPEIRGLVKTIVGNEVTVLKIDQPQRATSTPDGTTSTTRRTALSLNGSTGATHGTGGGGGFGDYRPGGEASATTNRTALLEQMKAMSTGEEKVTIPVGIKMLKSSSDTKDRTMVEANLSDITADKTITIWLNTSITDKKVASFVLIN